MFIQFDKQNIHVQVVCGILERFVPTKKVKEIHKRTEALKAKVEKFMEEEFRPEIQAIQKMVDEENEKHTPKENKKE